MGIIKYGIGRPALMVLLLFFVGVSVISCKEKNLKEADVVIEDMYRHYYPVIQGQPLPINYEITNVSDETLVIQEIQTSCGCIFSEDELPLMVLPNKKNSVRLVYNSIKNTGHVEHQIYLYGNFKDSTYRLLKFETNVVPPADYTRDYEVLYHEQVEKGYHNIEDLVDGNSVEKGYYTDDTGDKRENTRKERQEKADELINSVLKR